MSDEWPILTKPPIVEGLLDLQFPPLERSKLPELEAFQHFNPDYVKKNVKLQFAGHLEFATPGQTSMSHESNVIGYQFATSDGTRVLQVRLNGITVSFLAPYTTFHDLEQEASRLWALFKQHLQPAPPTRVALRYINRLFLPLPFSDFKEYILTVPEIAPQLPQALAEFSMRLMIPDTVTRSSAIVTEVMENQTDEFVPLIFDIDVFQTINPAETEFDLWRAVSELRDFKNRLFFSSITQKLRRLYE
jgi:uncharacterized protein (TIGR04255 family)